MAQEPCSLNMCGQGAAVLVQVDHQAILASCASSKM